MTLIMRYSIAEAVRRRIFLIVVTLSVAFLVLYGIGSVAIFNEAVESLEGSELVEERVLVGGTLTGLGMFITLFLGVVLAIFMTMSTVRGDAERGVLQPLAVRPMGRRSLLLGRLLAAGLVASVYVAAMFAAIVVIIGLAGDWTPDNLLTPALGLVGAVLILSCISVLGSTLLTSSANGIAVFMIFGAGLTAGLLGQIGEGLNSDSVEQIGRVASILLPFEALYQGALDQLTSETSGITEVAIDLGPFGGAEKLTPGIVAWAATYGALTTAAALRVFARRDI